MRVDAFDFELPPDRIALVPARPRDTARLLVVGPDGALTDERIDALPSWLAPGDVLVVNDTRVLPARLSGSRDRGGAVAGIEATLHRRVAPDGWRALVRPAKKLEPGDAVRFVSPDGATLAATVEEKAAAGEVLLRFPLGGAALDEALRRVGTMPLPPYIASRRPVGANDAADYQTMFADRAGAVAAPTAGLHFTPGLLQAVQARGVALERVTLHVGAGTFMPVKVEDTDDHRMHAEWGGLDAGTAGRLRAARARGARIVAVGTTSLRTLEAAAAGGELAAFAGDITLFITPGYRFRAVDVLMTNFHLPRSTLFMLVAAFSGLPAMQAAYAHAIAAGYRFYSYGDACLLHRSAA